MRTKGRRQSKNIEDKRGKSDRLVPDEVLKFWRWYPPGSKKEPLNEKLGGIRPGGMERAAAKDRQTVKNKNPFASRISPRDVESLGREIDRIMKKKKK